MPSMLVLVGDADATFDEPSTSPLFYVFLLGDSRLGYGGTIYANSVRVRSSSCTS